MRKEMSRTKRKSKRKGNLFNSPWLWVGLAVVAILAFGGIYLNQSSQAATAYPQEISVSQAADWRQNGAFILDVRQPEEWNEAHIPGATLIPLGELENRLNEVPKDQEVVVVCRSGNRSATGRDILRQAGFEQVTSMAGGMNQWKGNGYPVESGP
jgi:rhodanese-related sulfurtransferase